MGVQGLFTRFRTDRDRRPLAGRRRRLLALVVGVALLVVEWYATSLAFDRSVEAVETISDQTMPSVTYLAEVQGTLAQVAGEMRRFDAEARPRELRAIAAECEALLASARHQLRAYETLPVQAGERELWPALRDGVEAVSTSMQAALAEPDPEARGRRVLEEFFPALQGANAALRGALRLNAEGASQAARRAIDAHETAARRSLFLTIGLNGLLVVLWVLLGRQIAAADRERELRISDLNAFGGRVAHDLKGPLGTILMATELARKDPGLSTRSATALERIERSGERMASMIDGLLAFTVAGASSNGDAVAPVADVFASIRTTAVQPAESQHVTLTLEAEPGVRARVSEGVLSSIVQNLVRNAIAHMGESVVRDVRVRGRAVSPTMLELEVADTGPGIPEDVKRRLFLPFERGSTTAEGHGLGLATVKRLVDGHGGSIAVHTEVGRGTAFRIRLPRAP